MTGPGPVSGSGPVPAWIRRWAPSVAGGEAGALAGGVEALARALERTGRDRSGAQALLAADALLTTEVEQAAGDPDPRARLEAALEAVVELAPPEGSGGS